MTLYIEVSVMPIQLNGKIKGISFFGRDVTQKYLAEQQLIQKEKYLAEQNAAKDRLFSIISHDLRSPFNNIIGLSEVIEDLAERSGYHTIRQYAESILRVSKNTFAVLENLLFWSRSQAGKLMLHPAAVALHEVVANETDFHQQQLSQKLITLTNRVNQAHLAFADIQSVRIIVRNLISNAIKFSYSEGEIIVQSSLEGNNVLLMVQDFGCGMDLGDLNALFHLDKHPSRRGTQNESGTGIGLILCKELAEKNGGSLLVQSSKGRGSTFTLVLQAA